MSFKRKPTALEKGGASHPVATVAFYGPDDQHATKVVVGIVLREGAEASVVEKRSSKTDAMNGDDGERRRILLRTSSFFLRHVLRPGCLLAFALLTSGCTRRTEVVSCAVESLGLCHEWSERTEAEGRELREAVCHKSDERYSEKPCPRDDVMGTCEVSKTLERTIWYRGHAPEGFDVAAACHSAGGTWQPAS